MLHQRLNRTSRIDRPAHPRAGLDGPFTTLGGGSSGKEFLADVDTLLFDCDGVLWKGSALIKGADEAREQLFSPHQKMHSMGHHGAQGSKVHILSITCFLQALAEFRRWNKSLLFVTNNASKSR